MADPDATDDYKGHGVRESYDSQKHPPNNLYRFDEKYFRRKRLDAALFKLDIDEKDMIHLANDDMDEISRLEVTYKIMKQQMRGL